MVPAVEAAFGYAGFFVRDQRTEIRPDQELGWNQEYSRPPQKAAATKAAICSLAVVALHSNSDMTSTIEMPCDGCGQASSPGHIAERLKRLEWSTRYRPVHIQTLLLCATSQREEREFLYSPRCDFSGEAGRVLEVAGIAADGRSAEIVQAEFQRAGFFLTPVLECALEPELKDGAKRLSLLEQRLPALGTRIRRSLKPKRVALLSVELEAVAGKIAAMQLECPVVLDSGRPFALDGLNGHEAAKRLREALAIRID